MVCPEKKMHADIYIARFGRVQETFFQKFNLIHIVTYLSMYIWQGTSKNLCVPVWLWWITKKNLHQDRMSMGNLGYDINYLFKMKAGGKGILKNCHFAWFRLIQEKKTFLMSLNFLPTFPLLISFTQYLDLRDVNKFMYIQLNRKLPILN